MQVHQWTLCVLHEVAREALANALQHGRATRIDLQVELRRESVRDEGTTIEASAPLAAAVRARGDPGEAL